MRQGLPWIAAAFVAICATALLAVPRGVDPGFLFGDGFETGDTSAWSAAVGVFVPPPPTVESVSPGSGWNQDETWISIRGTHFQPTPRVFVGAVECTNVVYETAQRLTASVPPGLGAGLHTVTVENPDLESDNLVDAFRASDDPPPVISAVSPAVFVSADGGTLRIVGHDFDETAQAFLSNDLGDLQQTNLVVSATDAPCLDGDRCNVLEGSVSSGLTQDAYVVTVVNADGQTDVHSAVKVVPSADGKLSAPWTVEPFLGSARTRHGAAIGADERGDRYLYVAGGDGDGTVLDLVEVSTVGPLGDLSRWRTTAPLPEERAGLALLGTRSSDGSHFLFAFGGEDATSTVRSTVYRAQVLRRDAAPTNLSAAAVAGLQAAGNWVYRVAAVTAQGESLPGDLAAITIAGGGVELTWNAVLGALHYRVYRSDTANAGSGHLHLVADAIAPTTFTDAGAAPVLLPFSGVLSATEGSGGSLAAGTYSYAVSAQTPQGETAPSSAQTLSVSGGASVDLVWGAVADALFYSVYRTEADGAQLYRVEDQVLGTQVSDPGWALIERPGPASVMATPLTVAGSTLAEGTWQYQVVGVNEQGITLPAPSPAWVVNVGVGQNAVRLEWEPLPEALTYDVYRTDTVSGSELHRITSGIRELTYRDQGRPPGAAPVPASAGLVMPALGKISPLVPGSLSDWSVLAATPLLQALTDHGAAAVAVDGQTFLYAVGGRTDATTDTDQVSVAAVDDAGVLGAWRSLTPLPEPRFLLAAAPVVAATHPDLTNDGLAYLYAAQGQSSLLPSNTVLGSWVLAADLMPGDLAGAGAVDGFGSLAPGSWEYRVAAVYAAGIGPASDSVTVVVATGEDSAQLTWSAEADALEYVLYRRPGGSAADFERLDSGAIVGTSYLDLGDSVLSGQVAVEGGSGELSNWVLNDCLDPSSARFGHDAAAATGYFYLFLGEHAGGLASANLRSRVLTDGALATPNGSCIGSWPNAGDASSPTSRSGLAGARAASHYYAIGGDAGVGPSDLVESILF